MTISSARAEATRIAWLSVLDKYQHNRDAVGSSAFWSPKLDTASRDELRHIQDEKLAALTPFLYENSGFYRRRFDRLGLDPRDISNVEDLIDRWLVVTKFEMADDAVSYPPYGTYSTMTDEVWAERGWMLFSSSGTSGMPRVFRYSHVDRDLWAWVNARALHAMGIGKGDTVFMVTGFGPHTFAWGVQYAMEKMRLPTLSGGGMDAKARANVIVRDRPTVLLCTPSYALHLGRVMQEGGTDPRKHQSRRSWSAASLRYRYRRRAIELRTFGTRSWWNSTVALGRHRRRGRFLDNIARLHKLSAYLGN